MMDASTLTDSSRTASLLKTDRAVLRGCTAYVTGITLLWLYFLVSGTDGGLLFGQIKPSLESLGAVLASIVFFWFGWSYGWYYLKRRQLRRIGFSEEDLEQAFSTRLDAFHLDELLNKYPERKIRILDMISRRGRAAVMATVGFTIFYFEIRRNPGPGSLTAGLQGNLFEAIFMSWWFILTYRSNGFLGKATYGAQARVMDGVLARANCLMIATLWGMFKFVLIPIGIQLNTLFSEDHYAILFLFVWLAYLVGDTASEVVGSLYGKQRLRVWGLGEVNRKSVEGTVACFLGALAVCLAGVISQGLSWEWYGLALVISISTTVVELWSPRGTDDFFIATTNALLCWAFGLIMA